MNVTIWRSREGKYYVMDAGRDLWARWSEGDTVTEAMSTFRRAIAGQPALIHVQSGSGYSSVLPPQFTELYPAYV